LKPQQAGQDQLGTENSKNENVKKQEKTKEKQK